MKSKKKTIINIRAYSMDMNVQIEGKHISLDEAIIHVKKNIVDTAQVHSIIQIEKAGKTKRKVFTNPDFVDHSKLDWSIDIEKYKKKQ